MEVRLNRNGWHKKLQKFVFRNPPHFYNFCPYFWLTIFCILITFIVPVVPLIKGIKYLFLGFAWGFAKLLEGFNDYISEPLFTELARRMPDDEIMIGNTMSKYWDKDFWDKQFHTWDDNDPRRKDFLFWKDDYMGGVVEVSSKRREKLVQKFKLWQKNTPDWEKKIEEMKARQKQYWLDTVERKRKEYLQQLEKEEKEREQRRAKAERDKLKEQRKRKMFTATVKYTKYVAYALAGGILAFAGYWMYRFVNWVYNAVNWVTFWTNTLIVLKWAGLIILALAIVVGFIYGIVVICRKCTISLGDIPGMRKAGRGFKAGFIWFGENMLIPFLEALIKFFSWIGSGFKFLWIYIKTLKENNCPGIIWEDEQEKFDGSAPV